MDLRVSASWSPVWGSQLTRKMGDSRVLKMTTDCQMPQLFASISGFRGLGFDIT